MRVKDVELRVGIYEIIIDIIVVNYYIGKCNVDDIYFDLQKYVAKIHPRCSDGKMQAPHEPLQTDFIV